MKKRQILGIILCNLWVLFLAAGIAKYNTETTPEFWELFVRGVIIMFGCIAYMAIGVSCLALAAGDFNGKPSQK